MNLKVATNIARVLILSACVLIFFIALGKDPKALTGAEMKVGDHWQPIAAGTIFQQGATIRSGSQAVDLLLFDSKTSLRLVPGSVLLFTHMSRQELAENEAVTVTRLELLNGAVVGVQNKLPTLSAFDLVIPAGVVHIVGTEYYVSTSGAISVISGSVTVRFNKPGAGGSVVVTVGAGQSFDPATGQVVSTTEAFLKSIQDHVDTAQQNAEVFKAGGATIVVKPEEELSPIHPVGHGKKP